jgi:Uma2 family endonuclease
VNVESLSEWQLPEGGITAVNLYDLPGLPMPARTELIDGGLFFPGPPLAFHTTMVHFLKVGLEATRPDGFLLRTGMALTLELRTKVVPDILVLAAEADPELDRTGYPLEAVQLVVEVVAPISEIRDRELKPKLYAEAGITHFWRVEEEAGRPVAHVYEVDPATSTYFRTGVHRDRVKRTVPYGIDVDFNGLDKTEQQE